MLKLDPKNTELLSQKQKILAETIKSTQEYLNGLKETQKQFIESGGNLNSENYRWLQREIISTESKLKQLNLEASKWTQLSGKLSELSSKMKSFGDKIQEVGKKASVASGFVAGLFGIGVKYNADIEKSTKAFETFLGSAEKASEAVDNIRKQSEASPFDTKELIKANQYLITSGINADEARKTISALADAIALTGGGNDELNRMASNLQQIQNAGKATAMDIRQFAYAGIDVYGILAKTTGKNTEELKKMDITYEELSKALQVASSEGGKYYNGQIQMTDTLSGQISKLKKTFQDLLGELSESLMPIIGSLTEKLQSLVDWFKGLDEGQKNLITKIGLVIVAIGPALVVIGKIISLGGTVIGGISKIAQLMGNLQAGIGVTSKILTALTGPVGIVIGIIGVLIATFVHLYKTNDEFREKVQKTWQNIMELFQNKVMPIINKLKEFITNVLKTIWKALQDIWSVIEPFIKEIFENIMDWWNETGSDIVGTLMDVLGEFLDAVNVIWQNIISPIIKFLTEILKPIIGTVMGFVTGTIKGVLVTIKDVWNGIKGVLDGIINFITGVFKGNWSQAWQGIKQVFSNIINTFGSIFKAPINAIISGINGFIKGINKIKIPDWVPSVGGKGISIPLIPKLAKGGIVNSATIAMIGEGKSAEAVIPLDRTLTKYMAEAMKQAGGTGHITVNFYPQQMTEVELERAFNYIDKRFGMAY